MSDSSRISTLVASLTFAILTLSTPQSVSAQGSDWEATMKQAYDLLMASKWNDGIPVARKAVVLARERLGPAHPSVADSLHLLGVLHDWNEQDDKAESCYEQALAIREKALDENHPLLLASLASLARLYKSKREFEFAEPLLRRIVEINEHAKKATGVPTSHSHSLAFLDDTQKAPGVFAPLENLEQRMHESLFGPPMDLAGSLTELAELHVTQKSFDKAEPLLARALALHEEDLGTDNRTVAGDLRALYRVKSQQHHWMKAQLHCQRALAIHEKLLGKNDPDVARDLTSLAWCLRMNGNLGDAARAYSRAIKIYRKADLSDRSDLALAMSNYGFLCRQMGRLDEAELLFLCALSIEEKSTRPRHPLLEKSLVNLADFYRKTRRPKMAEPLEAQAKELRTYYFAP